MTLVTYGDQMARRNGKKGSRLKVSDAGLKDRPSSTISPRVSAR